MNFDGKVAFVTGGAVGIGAAIARELAQNGAKVIINYNKSVDQAASLLQEAQEKNCQIEAIQGNVSSLSEVKAMIDHIIASYGRIDIAVNNAGITADNLLVRMNEDDFDRVIQVNLKGTWNVCRQVIPLMMKERQGKIINISSVVGIAGNPGQSNYCAAKAGIIGLTKSLAKEVAKRGILVNAVAPGFIETNMTATLKEELKQAILDSIPLGKIGQPEEVAKAVAFLASDWNTYITGQVIQVDGGLVMA
ncbi:MAG: 3-oxoacyl-[acyl-carrier-protein] reductase [Bacilli bacterium]|jgi:3-oxoacyl-[acyl-carrier protein] reductase|nr:3-oxoacyl-[acyl-carrier-protein] reductase [Bacilli bacterium]MDY0063561.1 3-oxoacyl-[acyl-carrier-protein] reductase [Bacilli bacterium]